MFVTALFGKIGLMFIMIYPIQIARLALRDMIGIPVPWWIAYFLVVGNFPELIGLLKFYYECIAGKTSRIIEYK
jgi:hypothetical protein